jgi:prepilin-type N-terminal cleavage/methylation domain-containing protein
MPGRFAIFGLAANSYPGFTLLELVLTIAIVAILAGFALTSLRSLDEVGDATTVQSIQTSLQAMVAQGADRLDIPADQVPQAAVITALSLSPNASTNGLSMRAGGSAGQYVLTINASNRTATYRVLSNGDVTLEATGNFVKCKTKPSNVTSVNGVPLNVINCN